MSGFIADLDPTEPNGYTRYIDELDTIIQDFKAKVQDSFPNVNIAVTAVPANLDQTISNNFISTITENGVEVAKLTGARFTGPVYDPGDMAAEDDRLINWLTAKQMVQDALDSIAQ